jgi:flagellar biosynthesis/type III secretory pathway protein FliH
MSFLLWHGRGEARIASPRLVLRAAEVPLLQHAQALRDELARLLDAEAERIEAAGHASREQGRAQGREQGLREAGDTLAATLVSLAESAARERESLRGEIGALALQVVRKLLGDFADEVLLVALAETAARETLPAQQMSLVVHPDLRDAVRERLSRSAAQGGAEAGLRCEVRGDPSCARDACRIETEHGRVDATLEAQLARLAEAWGVVPGAQS